VLACADMDASKHTSKHASVGVASRA
jgi:hypothetical protein